MAERKDVAELTCEPLKRVHAQPGRMELDIGDLKMRMTAVKGHLGNVGVQIAAMSRRIDRLDERVGRIERRLDLTEA